MFKLRGEVKPNQTLLFSLLGFLLLLFVWFLLTRGETPIVQTGILPKPFSTCDTIMINRTYENEFGQAITETVEKKDHSVICAYGEMFSSSDFFKNLCLSLGFNFGGYIIALLWSIPVAFIIGLFPVFRATFEPQVNAIRFIPLTAITSIFIAAFSINASLKINFLAFGIMIYLIPIIIQRIDEVKDVYLKTVYTIGASKWQTIRSVYLPSVLSRLSDDIRVLTAISWTYIIVAEGIGDQGGLGSMIYKTGQRMGRPDRTFAILIIFILIGIIQDKLFLYLDKKFFPFKYQIKNQYTNALEAPSVWDNIAEFAMKITVWIFLGLYAILMLNEFLGFLGNAHILSYLFEDTLWVIHFIFVGILSYKVYDLYSFNKLQKA